MTSSFRDNRRFVRQIPTLTEVNKKDKVARHGDGDGPSSHLAFIFYLIVEASS